MNQNEIKMKLKWLRSGFILFFKALWELFEALGTRHTRPTGRSGRNLLDSCCAKPALRERRCMALWASMARRFQPYFSLISPFFACFPSILEAFRDFSGTFGAESGLRPVLNRITDTHQWSFSVSPRTATSPTSEKLLKKTKALQRLIYAHILPWPSSQVVYDDSSIKLMKNLFTWCLRAMSCSSETTGCSFPK